PLVVRGRAIDLLRAHVCPQVFPTGIPVASAFRFGLPWHERGTVEKKLTIVLVHQSRVLAFEQTRGIAEQHCRHLSLIRLLQLARQRWVTRKFLVPKAKLTAHVLSKRTDGSGGARVRFPVPPLSGVKDETCL